MYRIARRPTRSLAINLACMAVLAFVTFAWLLPAVETTPFHRDEARWVHRIQLLTEWRDPFGERWQSSGYPRGQGSWDELNRMEGQPPVASYILGLGLLLQGRDLETNGFWVMDRDDAWNITQGNMPERADLLAARRTNVALAALTVLGVFWLVRTMTNPLGGLLAGLYLAYHPLTREIATRAWADTVMVAVVVAAAITTGLALRHRSVPWAIGTGVLIGIGGGIKLSPLLLALPVALLGLIVLAVAWRSSPPDTRSWRRVGITFLTAPVIACTVFVASYPNLWPDPIGNTLRLFRFRADSFALQSSIWQNAAVETRLEAIERIEWRFSTVQFSLAGTIDAKLEAVWNRSLPFERIEIWLIAGGLTAFVSLAAWTILRGNWTAPIVAITAIIGAHATITFAALQVDYARYHLPLLIMYAVGIGTLGGLVARLAWRGFVGCRRLARHSRSVGSPLRSSDKAIREA